MSTVQQYLISDGSEFQVCKAATGNAHCANIVHVLSADNSRTSEEKEEKQVQAALTTYHHGL